jgi:hypothetical protein
MTQDLGKAINDGLFYYEQDLWNENEASLNTGVRKLMRAK